MGGSLRPPFHTHKRQPTFEKRFEPAKSVFDIAPVLLKNEGRIEAPFFVYFLVLLVHALIEQEIRLAMARAGIDDLPIYPEERPSSRPTAEQILRLFGLAQRHSLRCGGTILKCFEPESMELRVQVLKLLSVPRDDLESAT